MLSIERFELGESALAQDIERASVCCGATLSRCLGPGPQLAHTFSTTQHHAQGLFQTDFTCSTLNYSYRGNYFNYVLQAHSRHRNVKSIRFNRLNRSVE